MKDKRIVENLKLRERGQLTLPRKIRLALNLKTGTELIARIADREIILKPKIEDPLKYAGMFGKEERFTRVKDLIMKYRREK
jgi:AbrB family looped-hinge helix DNA binding protein